MNDKQIRPLIRQMLPNFHLIEELCTGDTRIDITAIHPSEISLTGYEIKGQTDSLKLLQNQVLQYEQVCPMNFLVAYGNHIEKALDILPDTWGIYSVSGSEEKPHVMLLRPATVRWNLDKKALLNLLWGDELRVELRKRQIKPRSMNCEQMVKVLEEVIEVKELCKIVCQTLKARGDWMAENRAERARIHQNRRIRAWVYGDGYKPIREGIPPADWVAPFEIKEKEERRILAKQSRELNAALRANGLKVA